MSACPVMMLNHNIAMDSSPPSSPSFNGMNWLPCNSLGSGVCAPPSPLLRLPTIVTHSTPPSSPTSVKMPKMIVLSPPPNQSSKKMTFANSCSVITTTPATPTAIVSSNSRMQPVARSINNSKTGKRKLGPGCSLVDWIRLCRSKTDIAGNGGEKRPISLEELSEHNTESDAWTAIRGWLIDYTVQELM